MPPETSVMTIVIGVDGSPGSDAAVAWVEAHGPALQARVTAVHVVSRINLWDLAALQVDTGPMLEERRHKLKTAWTDPLRAAGLRVTTRLVRGDPAMELLRAAEQREADLIVIGSKRHTAVRDIVLGGTAHKVVNHGRRPIVVVPAPSPPSPRKPKVPDTRRVKPIF